MFSTPEITMLSRFSLERESWSEARRNAGSLFEEVYMRALRRKVLGKLTGRKSELRSLSHYAIEGQTCHSSRVMNIPLDRIAGSEGRSEDFDAGFNPLKRHNRDRWISIVIARRTGVPLPPVELIQVGADYFVRDGHHRISVAKAMGQIDIEARIVN